MMNKEEKPIISITLTFELEELKILYNILCDLYNQDKLSSNEVKIFNYIHGKLMKFI